MNKRFVPVALASRRLIARRPAGGRNRRRRAATRRSRPRSISDVGRFNDKGFNQNQLTGLKMAQAKLGDVQTRAIESHSAGDYIPNLASRRPPGLRRDRRRGLPARRRRGDGREEVPEDPVRDHRLPGGDPAVLGQEGQAARAEHHGHHLQGEQQSYLVGCLSALMAKKGGGNTISATGGVKIPPVDSFIAGYRAGAAKCVPGTKVLVGYSQDFIAQDKCKAVAENQIAAGSKVVFAVAGPCGFGALAAAKEAGVWGDGVDVDQSYLGPHILTSAVKRVDLGRLPLHPGRSGRHARPGPRLRLRSQERRRRARQDQPEGAGGVHGEGRTRCQAADHRRQDQASDLLLGAGANSSRERAGRRARPLS